jgi:PAS domain S-box-containing protein
MFGAKQRSFAVRAICLGVVLVLGVLAAALHGALTYRTLDVRLERSMADHARDLASILSQALLSNDSRFTGDILDLAVGNQSVVHVAVLKANRDVFVEKGQSGSAQWGKAASHSIPIVVGQGSAKRTIGHVRLTYLRDGIHADVVRQVLGDLVLVLLLLAVFILASVLVNRFPLWRRSHSGDGARRGIDRALRESEERYRRIIETTQEGIWVVDATGKTTFVNRRLADMLGYTEEEMLGRSMFSFMDEEAHGGAEGNFARHRAGVIEQHDFRFRHKDESDVWTIVSANPMIDDSGEFVGALSMITDINERKRREEELRANEERLRLIVATLPFPTVIARFKDGKVLFANRRMATLFALSVEDFMGKTALDFYRDPADRQGLLDAITEHGSVDGYEVALKKTDETVFWAMISAVSLRYEGEDSLCIAFSDITARKEQEEELSRGKEEAEIASQAKSVFLATMSHEIRTPLNGLLGLVRLLGGTELTPVQREYLETVRYSGEALLTIINDILDLSQIEAGGMRIENTDFDLFRLTDSMIMLMSGRAEEKGVRLSAHLPGGLPPALKGDPDRLRQVLLNLIGNAVKFTRAGEISLKTEVLDFAENRIRVRFSVSDTGPGIPEDQLERIFEPFTQIESAANQALDGTGLGLAISKRIVDAMGGEIGVSSMVGEGSTFWFTVALERTSDIAEASDAMAEPDKEDAPLSGCDILVVEDMELNRRVAVEFLQLDGHHASIATNGREAVRAVEQNRFDLILMDIRMPEMDGMEATRRIRQLADPEKAAIPILAMTANVIPGDRERYLDAGMNDVLVKPVNLDKLRLAVARFLTDATAGPTDIAENIVSIQDTALLDTGKIDHMDDILGAGESDRLFNLCRNTLLARLDTLQKAERADDWPSIADTAHQMASAAGSYGLLKLNNLARRIEKEALEDQASEARKALEDLERLLSRSLAAVEAWRARRH